MVHGDPGIGKSALLDDAVRRVDGMRVLRVSSVEPEFDLGYAVLRRLLEPALSIIDRLAPPQADALRAVLGLASGETPDRFLVGLATLSLLSELAGERPLVCLVDDAQWADRPSMHVLEFVARRLGTEPVALVVATRTEQHPLVVSGVLDIPLTGLDRESARHLLRERAGDSLSLAQQQTVLDAAVGNPLALRELPAEVLHADLVPEPLPLTEELQNAFVARVRRHSDHVQTLMLLVAADGRTRVDVLRRAFALVAPSARWSSLWNYLPDDLVAVDETAVVAFRHPLIRSAVYHSASPAERGRAHRALATALRDDGDAVAERRAWHLGQATDGKDEAVAEELERSAYRAARVSSATAAALLARSAELSAPGPRRSRRRFQSAAAWWTSGDFDNARTMLESVIREGPASGSERWDVIWLRASLELHVGNPATALSILRPVLVPAAESGIQYALPLLVLFNEAAYCANVDGWAHLTAATELLDPVGDEMLDVLTRLLRGSCRVRAGKDAGLAPGDLEAVEQLTDPAQLWWASGFMLGLGQRNRARRLSRLAMQHARRLGAAVFLPWALWRVASDDLAAGRFRPAEAFAEEGRQFAEETGQVNAGLALRGSLAVLAAMRGRAQDVSGPARAVIAEGTARGMAGAVVIARRALGLAELAAGRPEQALTHFELPSRGTHLGLTMVVVPDLVEAAVLTERHELIAEPLAAYLRWADAANSPEASALAARCRALTASGAAAVTEYNRALALHSRANQPLELARTQYLFGRHLRRDHRPSEARDPLRAALAAFETLGAVVWADRARHELRAAGETRKGPATGSTAALTAQEAQIVDAVAEGLTNREIAAQLFLSPRTIDYHLRKVFVKTGVSSRSELTQTILKRTGKNQADNK